MSVASHQLDRRAEAPALPPLFVFFPDFLLVFPDLLPFALPPPEEPAS